MSPRIIVEIGDIAGQETEVIVNVPNSSLSPVGIVASRIHSLGGHQIAEECKAYIDRFGPVAPGQVVPTGAGNLKAKYLFHAIGPTWYGGTMEAQILASCYRESLLLATKLGLKSIAFPSIATGAGGFPLAEASKIFNDVIKSDVPNLPNIELIKMICADQVTFESYYASVNAK